MSTKMQQTKGSMDDNKGHMLSLLLLYLSSDHLFLSKFNKDVIYYMDNQGHPYL